MSTAPAASLERGSQRRQALVPGRPPHDRNAQPAARVLADLFLFGAVGREGESVGQEGVSVNEMRKAEDHQQHTQAARVQHRHALQLENDCQQGERGTVPALPTHTV